MENSSIIGIKTADGAFYPILENDYDGKKKLVLTTVRDNQETVQIDLYQKKSEEDESRQYVGSLVIENIQQAPKGDPEIEVIIGIDTDGNLNAVASDKATGNKQRLTTSLENLNEDELFDVPDFDLDETESDMSKGDVTMLREPGDDNTEESEDLDNISDEEDFSLDEGESDMTISEDNDLDDMTISEEEDFSLDESEMTVSEENDNLDDMTVSEENNDLDDMTVAEENDMTVAEENNEVTETKKKGNPILMILIILIGLAAIAGIVFLIFFLINQNKTEEKPGIEDLVENTDNTEVVIDDTEKKTAEEQDTTATDTQDEITDTAKDDTAEQDVQEQTDTQVVSGKDFEYMIKWGDTLWDLSATFYRDPLKYPVIANYDKNNISDPDFILADTLLYIPEQ